MIKSHFNAKMYAIPLLAGVLIGGIATLNSVATNSDTFGTSTVFKTQWAWAWRRGNGWVNPNLVGPNPQNPNPQNPNPGAAATYIPCPASAEFLNGAPVSVAYAPQYFNAIQVNGPVVNTIQINFNGRNIIPHPQYRIGGITASLSIPNIAMPQQLTCTYTQAVNGNAAPQAQFPMFQGVPAGFTNCAEVNTAAQIGFKCW